MTANYKFTKEHEWLSNTNGKVFRVGITDYAQKELGDIVFINLPKVGEKFDKGASFSQVESVKAVSDIYAPVAGKVTAINEELSDAPEKINEDPHKSGWIIELEVSNEAELSGLLDNSGYEKYLSEISK